MKKEYQLFAGKVSLSPPMSKREANRYRKVAGPCFSGGLKIVPVEKIEPLKVLEGGKVHETPQIRSTKDCS